jgi:hypothetical protein
MAVVRLANETQLGQTWPETWPTWFFGQAVQRPYFSVVAGRFIVSFHFTSFHFISGMVGVVKS